MRMKITFLLISFVQAFICLPAPGLRGAPTERSWTDSVYKAMSERERIGQLIAMEVHVTDQNLTACRDTIQKYGIGQIILTGGAPDAYLHLVNEVNQNMKIPLLITSAGYPYIGVPLDSAFRFPGVATIDKLNNAGFIHGMAEEVWEQERRSGIHANQTGLLNVDISNSNITLQGGRLRDYGDFHDWPMAFHRILTDSGIFINVEIRVTGYDSPTGIALELRDQSAFREIKMKKKFGVKNFDRWSFTITRIPFFELSGAEAVERELIDGIVRKQFGNKAVIVADLKSLRLKHYWRSAYEPAVSLLLGGMDVIQVRDHPEEVFRQLQNAVAEGIIKPRILEEKVRRILRIKFLAGPGRPLRIERDHFTEGLNRPEAKLAAMNIFRETVALKDGRLTHIPVRELAGHHFASLAFGDNDPEGFRDVLDGYAPFVHFSLPYLSCDQHPVNKLLNHLKLFDMVVVGFHPEDVTEAGQHVVEFFNQLSLKTKLVIVFFDEIRDEIYFSNRAAKVFVYENHPFTGSLAAQIIFGGFIPAGYESGGKNPCRRLGYGLPEEEQMDSRTLRRVGHIIKDAINSEDMPGCQVLIARKGKVIYDRSFGYYTYDSLREVSDNSIYDLASITKVASTTQLIMWLSGNGLIDTGKPLECYLPGLKGTNKAHLIIRDILFHQAGLKPFYPFWRYTIEDHKPDSAYYHPFRQSPRDLVIIPGLYASESLRDSVWRWTVETELLPKNKSGGYDYKYSDLGFYLLQRLIEKVARTRIDSLADSVFYRPMGMATMTYLPLCRFPRDRIVPTEMDTYFRQGLIWGTVHDPVAAMVGGVAGHAGLFSNAIDLAKLMQMNLNHGKYGGHIYLKDSVIEQFISQKHKNNRRSLGWDKPEKDKGYNPASRYASWQSYGHRGFTGTAVWVDPTFQLIYVFLSNRVCKDPEKGKKTDLNVRKRVHDVIYESMWNYQKIHNH